MSMDETFAADVLEELEPVRRTTRERREARAERLRGWADGQQRTADARYAAARAIGDVIPFGQPILVGHHSERSDRATRGRMTANYERSFAAQSKADSMRDRAANIEAAAAAAIYSDDADAVERLEERLERLEGERARWKAYNVSCRKGAADLTVLDDAQRAEVASMLRTVPNWFGPKGELPKYVLTNLGGNITRQRKRLEQLRRG